MKIIIAYFNINEKTRLISEKFRSNGFRGEISILGPNNKGVLNEIKFRSYGSLFLYRRMVKFIFKHNILIYDQYVIQ